MVGGRCLINFSQGGSHEEKGYFDEIITTPGDIWIHGDIKGAELRTLTGTTQDHVLEFEDANIKEMSQSLTLALNVLMSVILYAVGAVLVVNGDLTVGGLIGANILGSRAFASATKFVQTTYLIAKAGSAFEDLQKFFRLPLEQQTGTALAVYNGALEFKDLSFVYPGSPNPLFESLHLSLSPGGTLAITGYNGSGKTTLMRLIVGLLDPSRGAVLADSIDLRQIAPAWWRQQIIYVPQEPSLLNGSLRQGLTMVNPDLGNESLNEIIRQADLRTFLDKSPKGLETEIVENGQNLPVGIRKRIALARALATGGQLAVLDEPTEGLDVEGCKAVYAVLNTMARDKKTIVVVSSDPNIVKGAAMVLDLSQKPTPKIFKGQQVNGNDG